MKRCFFIGRVEDGQKPACRCNQKQTNKNSLYNYLLNFSYTDFKKPLKNGFNSICDMLIFVRSNSKNLLLFFELIFNFLEQHLWTIPPLKDKHIFLT